MSWVRIESSVARHRKFQQAGPAASWLWVCGLAYCQESATDGFIPIEALQFLGVKSPSKYASVLVRVGLWETRDGGWLVHDYLEHNRSAIERRGLVQDRREAGAKGGVASGEARRKQVAEATAKQTSNPSDLSLAELNSTELRARVRKAPIHDTSHIKHAFCGRVCMPRPLFDEFVRRRNTPNADSELIDWAITVDNDWSYGGKFADTEPGEPFVFWKARYAEKWPAANNQAPKSGCAPVNTQHSPAVLARIRAVRERELEVEQERAQKRVGEAS